MKIKNTLLTIFLIIEITTITSSSNRVKVSVYYESLCPYCINFITKKLYPHYRDFKDYIRIEWIPYGKANHTSLHGEWTFTCQHGKDECTSNKYQACALDQGRSPERNLEFINCVLSLTYPGHTPGIEYCARRNAFDWDSILNCFYNRRGDDLLAKMGRLTHNLRPKLKYVPTIVYNDYYDRSASDYALEDFVKATCSLIPDPKPKIC